MLVADFGADVIKVERPNGDPFRVFGGGGYSPVFQAHNRNKRSIVLDYSHPAGLEVLDGLIARADVLVINVRPGVAEKLNIPYARVHAINPRLIYCSITGFGASGPYVGRPAFDNVGQGMSGWSSRHRTEGNGDGRVLGPAVSDPVTAFYSAMGILAALYEREKSGNGRHVEVNMLESTMSLAIEPITSYLASGKVPDVYLRAALSHSFNLTCADGRRICLHLSSLDKFWIALCGAIGRHDLAIDYPSRQSRVAAYAQIALELNNEFGKQDRAFWVRTLEGRDIPFAAENTLDELKDDPQVKHLDVFHAVKHPVHGSVSTLHRPILVDGSRDIDFLAPPELGQHTGEVLREAGLNEVAIERLKSERVSN